MEVLIMYHKFLLTKNVDSFEYNLSTETLKVKFLSGRSYEYYNVLTSHVIEFMKNKDKFVDTLTKEYKYKEVK